MRLVASTVEEVILKDTGHWVLEERPTETTNALVNFLAHDRQHLCKTP
jgi:pimeloyl-ACP methyl ester carboxylesterase